MLRFVQGISLLMALAGIVVAVVLTALSVTDIFACILAFIPTGWGILSVSFLLSHIDTFTFLISAESNFTDKSLLL